MSIMYAHDKDVLFLPHSDIETEYHWTIRGNKLKPTLAERLFFQGCALLVGEQLPARTLRLVCVGE